MTMQIRVLFFGVLKELAGNADEFVVLAPNATVGDLLTHLENRAPRLKAVLSSVAMSVNEEYAGPEAKLKQGDEVALLPPVSGGAASSCVITREPIDTQKVLDQLKQPEDGAVVVFEGIVRNNTRGRRTLYLDYEAYESMAVKQMQALVDQALADFKISNAVISHRLGKLEIGETSVLIVVASAHRAAAFDACRWLIDSLKRIVPIWKKEHFEDGAVWADGEPFPAEIPKAEGISATQPASKQNSR